MTWSIVARDPSGALGVVVASRFFAVGALCPGREHRQFHLIDAEGNVGAYTGVQCLEWSGQLAGDGFSVAGNMLAGPQVIEDTAQVYDAARDLPFAERMMAAMIAGETAGGDKRGKQAVALLICTTEAYPFLDLRVDDHPEPLEELQRLYVKSLERYQPFVACLPGRARPTGVTDRASIEAEILNFHAARMHRKQ